MHQQTQHYSLQFQSPCSICVFKMVVRERERERERESKRERERERERESKDSITTITRSHLM